MTASTPDTIVSKEPAGQLRQAMVDQLKQAYPRQISTRIEQALRVVPRHLFCPPDTTLEAAYANGVVLTRHDATGRATSSVSAPWLLLCTNVNDLNRSWVKGFGERPLWMRVG